MVVRTVDPLEATPVLTPDQVLRTSAWPMRMVGFRLDVLDPELNVVGEAHPLRPGISVEQNINRDVKRTMSGVSVIRSEGLFDLFHHRLRPMWVLSDGTAFPLGVFVVSDASYLRHSWGRTAEFSLADQGLMLTQLIDRSVGFPAGYPVRSALLAVIEMLGLPSYVVADTGAKLGSPVAWAMGRDTWTRVLNDLADLAGFVSGYFDNAGTFNLRHTPAIGEDSRPDFDYDSPARVYDDSIVESDATLDSPNRYIVLSTSGNLAPVVGTWDVPATAPHSYENRGYRVVHLTERQGLSLAQAADTARAVGMQDADTYAWASFSAPPDPRHDTFNLVRWNGSIWREQSWTLDLEVGAEHRHELRRSYSAS
jgi:hypothetical protein